LTFNVNDTVNILNIIDEKGKGIQEALAMLRSP